MGNCSQISVLVDKSVFLANLKYKLYEQIEKNISDKIYFLLTKTKSDNTFWCCEVVLLFNLSFCPQTPSILYQI